jgi:hypothetical protein
MSRLFYVSGDANLAKRTLRLYVQVVSKAFQATGVGVELADVDTDAKWVESLVQGARMLCRLATSPGTDLDRMKDLSEAGELIAKARTRLDVNIKQLAASTDLAEGIWYAIMALKGEYPHSPPSTSY